jgi:hypothetical protein
MQAYITTDLNNPEILIIEIRTQAPPQGYICLAPMGEELEWLDIVDTDEDQFGYSTKVAIVNVERKAQILEARENERLLLLQQEAEKIAEAERLKAQVAAFAEMNEKELEKNAAQVLKELTKLLKVAL